MVSSCRRRLSILAALWVLAGSAVAEQPTQSQRTAPLEGRAALVPLGDLAGGLQSAISGQIANPFAGQADAIAQGKQLFIKMNCAGCHNYDGSGGMGPALTDRYWRYGGTPVRIYKSIYEGRPQGMPSWGQALPPGAIWKLVAFIQSFGGTLEDAADRGAPLSETKGVLIAPELIAEPRPAESPPLPDTSDGGDKKP